MSEEFVIGAPEDIPNLEPEPTPAPTQPAEELERSEVDMLKEIAEQYPTKKEARKHVKEILAQAKTRFNREFSKANAYKAIREKCKFTGEKGKVEAREATAKIEAPEEIELPIEPPEPPAPTSYPEQSQPYGYETPPAPAYPIGSMEQLKAELAPIQERSTAAIINNVFDIAGVKGEGNTDILSDQDSQDLVVLMPIIMKRLTNKANMTPEEYENLTLGLYVGRITTKAVKAKMAQKPKTPPPAPKPAQTPAPAQPAKEKPAQEPALIAAENTNKPFLKTLEKMK